jgi:hypothetical protein
MMNDLHAAPAATGSGLHHHRISNSLRYLGRVGGRADPLRARKRRHTRFAREHARCDLVAHLANVVRRRPDKDQPFGRAGIGELRLLRKEAVARMHRIASRRQGGCDDGTVVEIAVSRPRRSNADGAVCKSGGQRIAISLRVAITVSMPSIWHARMTRTAISPRLAIRTRRIVMALNVFITSIRQTVVSSSTSAPIETNGGEPGSGCG